MSTTSEAGSDGIAVTPAVESLVAPEAGPQAHHEQYPQELKRALSVVTNIALTLSAVTPASSVFIIIPVLFVVVGIFFVSWDRVFPVPMPERANFVKAALLVLFAYAGFENTPAPAGEFVNPKRDIPFALIVQILIVTAIYTTVQLVAIGTIPKLAVRRRRSPTRPP